MDMQQSEASVRRYFFWSVFLKGAISLAEVLAGLFIVAVPPETIRSWVVTILQNELHEKPDSFLLSHALTLTQDIAIASGTFIAIYLLSRGLIKLGLVVALLKNQLWAYPASLVVLGLFILYQIYEIAVGHSMIIIAITLFDFVVVYYIWREYGVLKKHIANHTPLP